MLETLESPLSSEPRYRINAVSEMTGLTAPNLRAWERRYGIPNPQRGENAYRLYSNRDITLLRQMKSLCDQGHAPSDAAKIALSQIDESTAYVPPKSKVLTSLEASRGALIQAAKDFDPKETERILSHAITLSSAWRVYQEVIEPSLVAIGELWESDHRYLANEHMLSQAVKSTLNQLIKITRPPKPRKLLLMACVAHEQHDLPLYALALRASHAGCLPVILGANTPPEALLSAVESVRPHAITLSATSALLRTNPKQTTSRGLTVTAEELIHTLKHYRQACGERPWLIGGRSTQTWSNLPADLSMHISSEIEDFDLLLE